jgi:xanthine/CO dehydrogenase XdhC/CoxF family maturation factor
MPLGDYNHYRHGHHPSTWGDASGAARSKTMIWLPEAIAQVETAVHSGKLLNPKEAMFLACGDARDKDTLYSIALRLTHQHELDLDILLTALSQRFPGYA